MSTNSSRSSKHGSPGKWASKGGGGSKNIDQKSKDDIVRKLHERFRETFDKDLITSVAHTCQWDLGRSTEALMILGGCTNPISRKGKTNKKNPKEDLSRSEKTKSLPSSLKSQRINSNKEAGSIHSSMPNGLRPNPAHTSTNSLASGQVWQRHYKSKPQSPGLLTMIPPLMKETVLKETKVKRTGSARSLPPLPTKQKEPQGHKDSSATILRIQQLVQNGMKVMVLMRGVPGSGKTYLAQVVVALVTNNEPSQHIFSTDDYFVMLGRGVYSYDSSQLQQAHNWNQKRVSEALRRSTNPVVVDNTHCQAWEMQAYVSMAVQHGYLIEVLEPVTPWKSSEAELARRNVHSVPREKIRQMLDKYEPGWTGDILLQLFGLKYLHCGKAHVPQEITGFSNSPLAQHRQHDVIEVPPEKPKRKKNSPKKNKKDRRMLAGIEITEDKEKQLDELNQLFAEYGKKMDPVSRKKVLESGVPISEVVSRMRQLQGTVLPLPKVESENIPTTSAQPTTTTSKVQPAFIFKTGRDSPSESVEPDTVSSSNHSETSECESESDEEYPGLPKYSDYGNEGRFVDGEDEWEDIDDDNLVKSEGAVSSKHTNKHASLTTSSQEELSLIDFDKSTTPAGSSQEELSFIDFENDDSSSSEEQETQMLTLQESLNEMFIKKEQKKSLGKNSDNIKNSFFSTDNYTTFHEKINPAQIAQDDSSQKSKTEIAQAPTIVELNESLLNLIMRNRESYDKASKESLNSTDGTSMILHSSLMAMLGKRYDNESTETVPFDKSKFVVFDNENNSFRGDNVLSPDLENIPLPSIPEVPTTEVENLIDITVNVPQIKSELPVAKSESTPNFSKPEKPTTVEEIMSTWEHVPKPETNDSSLPKPARPKSESSGVIKKTVTTNDKLPEKICADLAWSSVPFASSWENVNSKSSFTNKPPIAPKPQRLMPEKTNSYTNTSDTDFELWKTGENCTILKANNRNINIGTIPKVPDTNVPLAFMLDKSSMTTEEIGNSHYYGKPQNSVETLQGMFPDISLDNLSDLLDKCKGDISWTVELLLESSNEGLQGLQDPKKLENVSEGTMKAEESPYVSVDDLLSKISTTDLVQESSETAQTLESIIMDGKKTIKRSKKCKSSSSDASLLLKKQLEESFQINPETYAPRTMYVKKLRHGEFQESEFAPSLETTDDAVLQDIPPSEWNEELETMNMKLDSEFFSMLLQRFGVPDPNLQDYIPTLKIPISLARQIHKCWIENMNEQVEEFQKNNGIQEDELLASALQEQEREHKVPDLREIMDMELALSIYKQDQGQSGSENIQDTMATKLSKKLLFENYPNVDKNILLQIFHAEGNSFQKTVDVLSSQGKELPKTVMAPEFIAAQEQHLIEQAKKESLKTISQHLKKPIIVVKQVTNNQLKDEIGNDILVADPTPCRQEVCLLHKRRNDCFQYAQAAFRKKSYSVAAYYSHLAGLYKDRISQLSNSSVALNLFSESQSVSTTLDLHFLFVSEALQILDLFLDYHIAQMTDISRSKLDLHLITGRGLRSKDGVSKIKPAVKRRLYQRHLEPFEINPGMLRVAVSKHDILTENL